MITTYFRSSSFNAHTMCPQQYYLSYVLGVPSKAGKAAAKGNACHKALELLAWQSKCRAEGLSEYVDESFGPLVVSEITPEWAIRASYDLYREIESHVKWVDRYDFKDCEAWFNMALQWSGGRYDPRNLDVILPEQRFDFELEQPWARYDFDGPDGPLEGRLGLKGTMDLIVRVPGDPDAVHVIDWKTGARRDWAIEDEAKAEKTYRKLNYDPQLLLYYYAATRLYPGKTVDFTIVYVKDGGPFRLCFGPEHLAYAEAMIREKFEEIVATRRPELKRGRKCFTFCYFGKNRKEDDPKGRTLCQFYADEVRAKGIEAVTAEHGRPGAFSSYGDGGGRKGDGQTTQAAAEASLTPSPAP